MHRIFQSFIDDLANSTDATSLRATMATAATWLDVPCFAYLALPSRPSGIPQLISTYPAAWTAHYVRHHYERFDPIIVAALQATEPFEWGIETTLNASPSERQLFEEASAFGIRCGFTIPIHDPRGPVAAVTFASDEPHVTFKHAIEQRGRTLQLMAMYFHSHARRKLAPDRVIDGIALSPREYECLEWAARGKSAWEIGRIIGVSRRTSAFHLENAKAKLGVRSICQAVARLAASKPLGS